MSAGIKISGSAFRVALVGVATILLGGCSETGQFGNSFGTPYASSNPRVDRTPTGSIDSAPSPMAKVSNFFSDTFRPFDSEPAPAMPQSRRAAAYRAPENDHPVPPEPIASAPLAPATRSAIYSAPAPVAAPARLATSARRPNPQPAGGGPADGGTPVVVAQGENAEIIAQRYGVPVATLLTVNGYSAHAQLPPGSRLTIPVYRAKGGRIAAAAAPAPVAPVARHAPERVARVENQRIAPRSLVGEELAQTRKGEHLRWSEGKQSAKTAALSPADARKAKKAARLAQEQATQEQAAQETAAQAKAAKTARLAQLKTGKEKTHVAAAAKAAPRAAPAKLARSASAAPVDNMPVVKNDTNATASLPPPAMSASSDSADPEFRWPARGRVIQGFGSGGNDGINIAVPEGTQVKAAESGTVVYAGSELKGYGNLVLIRHPNGFVSAYANNGSLEVKRGQTVRRGQTVALSGQSGDVASPQLHFELRKGSKPVDPSKFLAGL
jgi:murein DD-endopeptidase MepM/ murein hydrolase activator NlpD